MSARATPPSDPADVPPPPHPRLQLEDLLISEGVPALQRVARATARLLGADAVQLNLITEDRQIPVSHVGGERWGRAVDLDRSYCREVVHTGEPLAIVDALEHPLVRESPATREMGIRGYLSVPVFAPREERPVATLCAVTSTPRNWTSAEVETLEDLAAWAYAEIEMRLQALHESESRFRAMADTAPVLIWMAGTDMLCDWFNRPWLAFTGRTMEQELGDGWAEGVHPDDYDRCLTVYRSSFEAREPFSTEYRLRRADGKYRWLLDNGVPRYATDGAFLGYIGSCVDIHQQVEQREQLEQANRAKTEFLSTVSHELRTPLNAIAGYIDLIAMEVHGPVTDAQRHSLDRARRSQGHLLRMINDLLQFAKLEAGHLEFDLREVPVRDALAQIAPVVEPQAHDRDVEYVWEACSGELVARADADRLYQILMNLIGNALKFTPAGGSVSVRCTEDGGERLRLEVRDTGRGIDPDRLESIFDPFVQLDRTPEDGSRHGVGLGLAISRDLARAMGGDVVVESERGAGSTFTVVLPRA